MDAILARLGRFQADISALRLSCDSWLHSGTYSLQRAFDGIDLLLNEIHQALHSSTTVDSADRSARFFKDLLLNQVQMPLAGWVVCDKDESSLAFLQMTFHPDFVSVKNDLIMKLLWVAAKNWLTLSCVSNTLRMNINVNVSPKDFVEQVVSLLKCCQESRVFLTRACISKCSVKVESDQFPSPEPICGEAKDPVTLIESVGIKRDLDSQPTNDNQPNMPEAADIPCDDDIGGEPNLLEDVCRTPSAILGKSRPRNQHRLTKKKARRKSFKQRVRGFKSQQAVLNMNDPVSMVAVKVKRQNERERLGQRPKPKDGALEFNGHDQPNESDEVRAPTGLTLPCRICHRRILVDFGSIHLEKIHGINDLECCFCPKIFDSENLRDLHYETKHGLKFIACRLCDHRVPSSRGTEHLKEVHEIHEHECCFCPRTYEKRVDLRTHMKLYHLPPKPTSSNTDCRPCRLCHVPLTRKEEFKHMELEHDKPAECPLCDYKAGSADEKAGSTIHELLHVYLTSSIEEQMKRHILYEHKKKSTICGYCRIDFKDLKIAADHRKRCRNDPNGAQTKLCNECGVLVTVSDREKHNILFHNKSKSSLSYTCPHCSRKFPHAGVLKRHLLQEHFPEKREFTCATCGKSFVSKAQHERHTKIHEEPSLKCPRESCDKTFRLKKAVMQHLQGEFSFNSISIADIATVKSRSNGFQRTNKFCVLEKSRRIPKAF